MLTWWQVRSRAVHTNTPDTPRANALVRKSWGGPCEPLSTRSICGPAATVGISGEELGGIQVADTKGAPAVFRKPDAFLICRSQQRSEQPGQPPPLRGSVRAGGGAGDGQGHVGVAQGPALPTAVSAWLATIPSTPPISTEASLGAHRGHLSPLWESALAFPPTLLTLGSRGIPLEGQGTWPLCCLGLRSWVDVLGGSPLRFLCALGLLTANS